jgi:phage terminase large subunit
MYNKVKGVKMSNNISTKATFYLDKDLYKAFKVKAALSDKKISDLMNETLRSQMSEDEQDIKAIRNRAHDNKESYDDFLKALETDGLI